MKLFNLFVSATLIFLSACTKPESEIKDKTAENNFTISVNSLLESNPAIQYQTVHKKMHLHYSPFPIASDADSYWADPIIPETFILTIPNGQVLSNQGYVCYKDKLVEELIWPWSEYKRHPETWKVDQNTKPNYVKGRVLVLTQEGYANYYHWMSEVLPRLFMVQNAKVEYDWVYLPAVRTSFMEETLEFLGIDKNKIIGAKPDTHLTAEKLIVPSFATRSCHTPHWIAQNLQEKLLPIKAKAQKNINTLPKKFFISRSKAAHRRITNETDIRGELEKRDFQTIYLEDLSVPDQIALFNNAEFIVAAHGAGLTNMLFAKPGTKVIEIFQAHEDETYFDMAQILKLDYQLIQSTPFVKNGGYTDTHVPWELVKEKVDTALASISKSKV